MDNIRCLCVKDHHAIGGLVHMVDKVVQPATLSIAELLATDTQFSSFRAALGNTSLNIHSLQLMVIVH